MLSSSLLERVLFPRILGSFFLVFCLFSVSRFGGARGKGLSHLFESREVLSIPKGIPVNFHGFDGLGMTSSCFSFSISTAMEANSRMPPDASESDPVHMSLLLQLGSDSLLALRKSSKCILFGFFCI